jgi:hypothetical protein
MNIAKNSVCKRSWLSSTTDVSLAFGHEDLNDTEL